MVFNLLIPVKSNSVKNDKYYLELHLIDLNKVMVALHFFENSESFATYNTIFIYLYDHRTFNKYICGTSEYDHLYIHLFVKNNYSYLFQQ